jgi:Flp pilus assembly protein TadD
MMLKWFDAREAADVGAALAEWYVAAALRPAPVRSTEGRQKEHATALRELHERADRDVRILELNFYQRARFANSFKWRLIENGVKRAVADDVTQSLIVYLSQGPTGVAGDRGSAGAQGSGSEDSHKTKALLARAKKAFDEGNHAQAVELFDEFVSLVPDHADALNALGVALYNLGRYQEAEQRYREAIDVNPQYANALVNLAALQQANPKGAEPLLRRVLKINPKHPGARAMLGVMLLSSGDEHGARAALRKARKVSPNDPIALLGLAQIARVEGRFDDAQSLLKRTLEVSPKMPTAWAELNTTRKMTAADSDWFATAEEIVGSGISLWDETQLRFAMGKYCDDIEDYERAFANYRRGNELLKSVAGKYDRQANSSFADDMIRVYTREILALTEGGSASAKPVFVLGMPRSGTSLTEQIIASHPAAGGVGELDFWLQAARAHQGMNRQVLDLPARKKIAEDYLHLIERRCPNALRIVDKTPANSDLVGFIHTVFPNARIIRMRRDPIDTCLSCYFQNFSTGLTFTMDLADLADYYRVHQRLMNHWCSELPSGTILEVPYEELVSDQEAWTRKILDFIGLEWDERCLAFHETKRSVVTASAWQVRQKVYQQSVERWRNYAKFVGPLKGLKE